MRWPRAASFLNFFFPVQNNAVRIYAFVRTDTFRVRNQNRNYIEQYLKRRYYIRLPPIRLPGTYGYVVERIRQSI